jgi:hypothetical protein
MTRSAWFHPPPGQIQLLRFMEINPHIVQSFSNISFYELANYGVDHQGIVIPLPAMAEFFPLSKRFTRAFLPSLLFSS